MQTIAERNLQTRIDYIDQQIAELTAKREALLNPPFAKGDLVTEPGDTSDCAGKTWRVTHVDSIDPRLIGLESVEEWHWDVRRRGNWPAERLVKI